MKNIRGDKVIKLEDFILKNIENDEEEKFINELFKEEKVYHYLGNLSNEINENTYIVYYENNMIGYTSLSKVEFREGRYASTLYNAISTKYANKGYGTLLLKEYSDYLLDSSDVIILNIDTDNIASIRSAEKAGFVEDCKFDDQIRYKKDITMKRKIR